MLKKPHKTQSALLLKVTFCSNKNVVHSVNSDKHEIYHTINVQNILTKIRKKTKKTKNSGHLFCVFFWLKTKTWIHLFSVCSLSNMSQKNFCDILDYSDSDLHAEPFIWGKIVQFVLPTYSICFNIAKNVWLGNGFWISLLSVHLHLSFKASVGMFSWRKREQVRLTRYLQLGPVRLLPIGRVLSWHDGVTSTGIWRIVFFLWHTYLSEKQSKNRDFSFNSETNKHLLAGTEAGTRLLLFFTSTFIIIKYH